MQAMTEREARCELHGTVQLDDTYLGGERTGGKPGRGLENKVPFVAAVSVNDAGHPLRVKLTPVAGFRFQAITEWARASLAPGSTVHSDGLACFRAVARADCRHQPTVVAERKPQGPSRISMDQHGGLQPQDQPERELPCVCVRPVRGPFPSAPCDWLTPVANRYML